MRKNDGSDILREGHGGLRSMRSALGTGPIARGKTGYAGQQNESDDVRVRHGG